jgi:hypothetical protein
MNSGLNLRGTQFLHRLKIEIAKLFDHKDKSCLPDNQRALYWMYVSNIRQGFENLKEKKQAQGLIPKTSNNIGEIHSIALAQLI